MEILTAYVRKNSCADDQLNKSSLTIKPISMDFEANKSIKNKNSEIKNVSLDIQTILTVIGRRENFLNDVESHRLNLRMTCLQGADLNNAHLERANLMDTHLEEAKFQGAHLEESNLVGVHFEGSNFDGAHFEGANLGGAH